MSSEAYEILALLMRYVFALIGVLIVFRSFIWLRKDARAYRKEIAALPDAGLIGEIVDLDTGKAQPLPHEGVIGSARECDIRVKGDYVLRRHARFEFVEGKGLKIIPARRGLTLLGGVEMRGPGYALHGTQLGIGSHTLRVRLFAGLNVPTPAAYPEPDTILDAADEDIPWTNITVENAYYLPEETPADAVPFGDGTRNYDGNYDDDGQMTWQYAYSLDELRQEQAKQAWIDAQEDEPAPRESRRRRRGRRE
ncbi:MAG: FHA domain-containing protein [Clostridia bacterium]|nr:FHA domain-containing protein [Clostridia bacterium]MBR0407509.1 FHA domain-containing protein [Clostridia bacterium]